MIKDLLLPPRLKKIFPDYVGLRTFFIESATPLNPQTPESNNLMYANREFLEQYVRTSNPKIPINPSIEEYPDVISLREAIMDYIQNPNNFVLRETERQRKRKEQILLRSLNPDLEI